MGNLTFAINAVMASLVHRVGKAGDWYYAALDAVGYGKEWRILCTE